MKDNKPLISILTRASRPEYFDVLMKSIKSQTYDNYDWIIGSDNNTVTGDAIKLLKTDSFAPIPRGLYYAPYNMYLNRLQEEVQDGFVMALDDDDCFYDENSLQTIVQNIGSEDELLVWKVQINPNWIVPSRSFGHSIVACDFSGIGMLWHSKYKPNWGYWSQGDYRAATQIVNMGCKIKWVDEVLTRTQRGPHGNNYGK